MNRFAPLRAPSLKLLLAGFAAGMPALALVAQDFEWEQRTSMPAPRWGVSTFVINDKAYVIGGRSGSVDHTQMWMYDPVTDAWTAKASLPAQGRRLATAFSVNGYGYVGCGITGTSTYLSDFWRYDPSTDNWT